MQAPTKNKTTTMVNGRVLEKLAAALTARSTSLQQRIAHTKKLMHQETLEMERYVEEIDDCLERIEEIDAFCQEVRRDRLVESKLLSSEPLEYDDELLELAEEKEEESELLAGMMEAMEAHRARRKTLMTQYVLLCRAYVDMRKKQRLVVMVALRFGFAKLVRRKRVA